MGPWMPAFAGMTGATSISRRSVRLAGSGVGRGARHDRLAGDGVDRYARLERHLAAVLVSDLGRQLDLVVAAVKGLDGGRVFLGDKAPAHLAGAGDLGVVGVKFLAQQQKAADARRGRQARVATCDLAGDQPANFRLGAQILKRGIGEGVALGPVADGAAV